LARKIFKKLRFRCIWAVFSALQMLIRILASLQMKQYGGGKLVYEVFCVSLVLFLRITQYEFGGKVD